jgi:hypothetical protein
VSIIVVMSKSPPSREYENFEKLLDRLLTVPRAVVEERIKTHRERAARNPVRRGPKPKKAI